MTRGSAWAVLGVALIAGPSAWGQHISSIPAGAGQAGVTLQGLLPSGSGADTVITGSSPFGAVGAVGGSWGYGGFPITSWNTYGGYGGFSPYANPWAGSMMGGQMPFFGGPMNGAMPNLGNGQGPLIPAAANLAPAPVAKNAQARKGAAKGKKGKAGVKRGRAAH